MVLKRKSVRVASVIVMVTVAIAILIAPDLNSGWLLASKFYGDLGLPEFGVFARTLVYATSALMAMSILAWIPTRENLLTEYGTRTIYVYLLHGFFIQLFRDVNLFEVNGVVDLAGLAIIAATIVLFLSSKPIQVVSQPIIEGKLSIIRNTFSNSRKRVKREQGQ